jgi:hypothetical protein
MRSHRRPLTTSSLVNVVSSPYDGRGTRASSTPEKRARSITSKTDTAPSPPPPPTCTPRTQKRRALLETLQAKPHPRELVAQRRHEAALQEKESGLPAPAAPALLAPPAQQQQQQQQQRPRTLTQIVLQDGSIATPRPDGAAGGQLCACATEGWLHVRVSEPAGAQPPHAGMGAGWQQRFVQLTSKPERLTIHTGGDARGPGETPRGGRAGCGRVGARAMELPLDRAALSAEAGSLSIVLSIGGTRYELRAGSTLEAELWCTDLGRACRGEAIRTPRNATPTMRPRPQDPSTADPSPPAPLTMMAGGGDLAATPLSLLTSPPPPPLVDEGELEPEGSSCLRVLAQPLGAWWRAALGRLERRGGRQGRQPPPLGSAAGARSEALLVATVAECPLHEHGGAAAAAAAATTVLGDAPLTPAAGASVCW